MATWDWQVFCRDTGDISQVVAGCFGHDGTTTYLDWLLSAWGWTATVAAGGLVIALVVGSLMGVLRTVPNKLVAFLATAWTELFRNIPLLVQLFIWYHVLPAIITPLRAVPSSVLVILALGFFTSARVSEQVKAGILALPRGQRQAGLAVGLSLPQTYRYVLLPMAFRIVIPPLTSESMNIVKNSSVAFAVSIAELTQFSIQATEETSRGVEIYLAVSFLYFVSAFLVYQLAHFIERRVQVPGTPGGGR